MESVGAEIFLTYHWCRIWWRHYGGGRELRNFIFMLDDSVVGILPLFFDRVRLGPLRLQVCKIVGTDFTPITLSIPIKKDFTDQVIRRLREELSDYDFDILHLGPIAGLYDNFDGLYDSCGRSFGKDWSILTKTEEVQTYFKVAQNWTAYMQALSKNKRKKIKKYLRLVEEVGTLKSVTASENDFDVFFDEFVEMHKNRWNSQGKAGHFNEWPGSYAFHRQAALAQLALGRLRLRRVMVNNISLGYKYCYRFGERYFQYLNARATSQDITLKFPYVSLGVVVFAEHLKAAFGENIKWLDSMRGRYEDKLQLGGELYPIKNIYIYKKSLSGSMRTRLFMATAWLIDKFYYKLWHSRIAPKLRLRNRKLRQKWIRTYSFSLLR